MCSSLRGVRMWLRKSGACIRASWTRSARLLRSSARSMCRVDPLWRGAQKMCGAWREACQIGAKHATSSADTLPFSYATDFLLLSFSSFTMDYSQAILGMACLGVIKMVDLSDPDIVFWARAAHDVGLSLLSNAVVTDLYANILFCGFLSSEYVIPA